MNSERGGGPHLQVHPDFRYLEEEMVAWAEQRSSTELELFVFEYDVGRQRLIEGRGYERKDEWGVMRHMRLANHPLGPPPMAEGYLLRTTRPDDDGDCQGIADILNAAFGRTFHNGAEYRTFTQQAPCYRPDLDLVAVAPDGTFGSYVGVPYDDVNRRGIFEPVCTHPGHRRRGLAAALMREGLRRLAPHGAVDVVVETGQAEAANALYVSLGFTEAYRAYAWRKSLR